MKILHLYTKSDPLTEQHVALLADGLRQSADVKASGVAREWRQLIAAMQPDILHCHGCWSRALMSAAAYALRQGARIVLSPHGQLEPWVLQHQPAQERLRKAMIAQRKSVERCYALIAFGRMEEHFLGRLAWNPRIEVIHNALITNSITPQQMATQTLQVYQKVMDSNTLQLSSDDTRQMLALLIKAGITGDKRWISDPLPDDVQWRQLLLCAEHENIRNYVDYGISTLGLKVDQIDTAGLPAYFPPGYSRPEPLRQLIGEYKGDETDYLVRMIRQIQKQPLLLHLIELSRELRRDNVDEERLREVLEEKKLLKYASRLVQVLSEQTLLDEGYQPLTPVDDRGTRQIRNAIFQHLAI